MKICDRSLLRRQPIDAEAQYNQPVAEIAAAVRARGDAALREYTTRFDRVTLPHLSQFESGAEYYATLFHELVHATGAKKRLDRFGQVEGDRFERYSFEELVAEFGAAFLGAFAGIESPGTEALQASYIQGWAAALRKDQRLVVRAASAAQRATDYIRGKVIIDRPEPESHVSEAAPVETTPLLS